MIQIIIIHAFTPSFISLRSCDYTLVFILILEAYHIYLYIAYLLLNMSLALFLGVQTPQVSTTRSKQGEEIPEDLQLAEEERE